MIICALALALALATARIETDPDFKNGQEFMEAFDYEKAAEVFEGVAKRPGITDPNRALALVWLGLAAAELRDQARASLAFEDAIIADPLIVLPRDASPKIKTILEDARARARLRPKETPTPMVAETPSTESPPPPPSVEPPSTGGGLLPAAIGTVAVGALVGIAGGALWGGGMMLQQQAVTEPLQIKAAELRDQSVIAQISGQVMTGVGVLALVAGAALFAVNAME